MDGFDLKDPLVCEGIIGDGCGGGRVFHITRNRLLAYDPQTQESITLLEGIVDAQKITKDGCLITIVTQKGEIIFDLSLLRVID